MEIVSSRDGLADYLRREAGEGDQAARSAAGNRSSDGSRSDQSVGPDAPRSTIFLDRFLENATEVDVDALCDGREVWIGGIMQHVEEAGVHSGDSACVLPP